ncbi:MAG TPA: hypothetical protein PKA37_10700 [Planctomycetota bacterium]|nr:hypothetical protein [Planctomycetota bacterium]
MMPLFSIVAFLLMAPAVLSQTEHRVILIILGGGVRGIDLADSERLPNLHRLFSEGVSHQQCRVENLTKRAATRAILSGGISDPVPAPDQIWKHPTLFEVLRKDRSLTQEQVWLIFSGPSPAHLWSASDHPEHGRAYAPSVLALDQVLSALPQRKSSAARGTSAPRTAGVSPLAELLDKNAKPALGQRALAVLTQFILEESTRENGGPGESDARALRCATYLTLHLDPVFQAVILSESSASERRHGDGLQVLDRIDREMGALLTALTSTPERAARHSVVLAVDHGRNGKVNGEGALGFDDGSPSVLRVPVVFWGAAFKNREVSKSPLRQVDIAPTLGRVFDVRLRHSDGKPFRPALP